MAGIEKIDARLFVGFIFSLGQYLVSLLRGSLFVHVFEMVYLVDLTFRSSLVIELSSW